MDLDATTGPVASASQIGPVPATASLRYMPGLDVMRGLAIVLVVLYHGSAQHIDAFFAYGQRPAALLLTVFHFGTMGVHLFFILSGFLITGILLDSRGEKDYFRNFYLRRVLRIVPAYLLTLVVLIGVHAIDLRYLLVCLLYFCNMTGLLHTTPQYGPLWSLSVEEQFYLVWPMLVLKFSRRGIAWLSVALILITPPLRLALLYGPTYLRDITVKTWAVMDFFAAGALLALAIRSPRVRSKLPALAVTLVLAGSVTLGVYLWCADSSSPLLRNMLLAVKFEPWLLLWSGLVLLAFLRPGMASTVWGNPLVFFARISYGLYLYHVILFYLVSRYWPAGFARALHLVPNALVQFAVSVGLSIGVAYLSRNTLEEFFLRLKPKHMPSTLGRGRAAKIT